MKARRGATMFTVVLFLSVLIAGASAVHFDTTLAHLRYLLWQDNQVKAHAAADAVVEKLRVQVDTAAEAASELAEVTYRTDSASATAEAHRKDGVWHVEAVGKSGTGTPYPATVTLEVRLQRSGSLRDGPWTVASWAER